MLVYVLFCLIQTIIKDCERLAEEQLDDLQMVSISFTLFSLHLGKHKKYHYHVIHFAFASNCILDWSHRTLQKDQFVV